MLYGNILFLNFEYTGTSSREIVVFLVCFLQPLDYFMFLTFFLFQVRSRTGVRGTGASGGSRGQTS